MPTDACVFFHACSACGVVLRPKAGDCCVFCSYGSVPCPPVQLAGPGSGNCCGPALPRAAEWRDGLHPHAQVSMTDSIRRAARSAVRRQAAFGWADAGGALGAAFAALCCMGAPVIVGVLGAVGLGWLRQDAILWPLMFLSLGVAFWGLVRDWRRHGSASPLSLALVGAVALVMGVVVVHGPPARLLIYAGALALVAATLWNAVARRRPVAGPVRG